MSERTKRQHVVPKFYLSKFCDSDGKIWTYGANMKPLASVPEKTGVETNFYSPIGPDGERYDEIEPFLSQIEGGAAPLWGDLSNGRMPTGEDRDMISLFLAAQYLRSPFVVTAGAELAGHIAHHATQVLASHKQAHERSVDDFEAETGETISPEEREWMREFLSNPDNHKISVLRSAGLQMLGGMETIANMFFNMTWVVGRSKDQHLITSDSPVTRVSDPATHHPLYGDAGFANKTVSVQFPLSPDRMLEMTWQGIERDRVVEIPKKMAREMNGRRAFYAERYVFGSQRDGGIQKLCDKWLSREKLPKVTTGRDTAEIEVKRKL